jgi:esterase/lipase superfamily enzyme
MLEYVIIFCLGAILACVAVVLGRLLNEQRWRMNDRREVTHGLEQLRQDAIRHGEAIERLGQTFEDARRVTETNSRLIQDVEEKLGRKLDGLTQYAMKEEREKTLSAGTARVISWPIETPEALAPGPQITLPEILGEKYVQDASGVSGSVGRSEVGKWERDTIIESLGTRSASIGFSSERTFSVGESVERPLPGGLPGSGAASTISAEISLGDDPSAALSAAIGTIHDHRTVGLFFATNRERNLEENRFTGERGKQISFGRAFVRVPEAHRIGAVELPLKFKLFSLTLYEQAPDPEQHFVIRDVQVLWQTDWCELIETVPASEALIFVHGFNTSFEDALYRNAQIVWDLKYAGIPVLFSWPSRGGIASYEYDRESALGARQAFLEVLHLLRARHNVKQVHVLAHSMGNLVVLDALSTHPEGLDNFGELMMAAPDIDRDHYTGIAPAVRKITKGMTLYASSADKALALSKTLAGGIPRAGDVPPDGPIIIPNIESIDATPIGDDIFGLNHSTFSQARSILNDLGILISTGQRPPDKRLAEIRCVPEGTVDPRYWRYSP